MCLKKRYGFSELWVQSLRSMGSECQWAKQRVAKMGFGGFETQAPGPLWSKLSRGYRETEYQLPGTAFQTQLSYSPKLPSQRWFKPKVWWKMLLLQKHTNTKYEGKAVVWGNNVLTVWMSIWLISSIITVLKSNTREEGLDTFWNWFFHFQCTHFMILFSIYSPGIDIIKSTTRVPEHIRHASDSIFFPR